MNWTALTSMAQIDEIIAKSFESPIIIFKHSTRCSISSMAYGRLQRGWDDKVLPASNVYYLDLIAHRDISNQVAATFGVMHESPQVIVVHQGKPIYDDSHMSIRFEAIKESLKEVLP